MSIEILLWTLPGLFASYFFYYARPNPHKGSSDFIFRIVPYSASCYFLARITLVILEHFIRPRFPYGVPISRYMWDQFFPRENSFTLITSIFYSPFVGFVLAPLLYSYLKRFMSCLNASDVAQDIRSKLMRGTKRELTKYESIFSKSCGQLINKPIFLTLKGGKVYVAILLECSSPHEENGFIKISPIMSGYRDANHVAVFKTAYIMEKEGGADIMKSYLLVPVRELLTMAEFKHDIHEHFQETGSARYEFPPKIKKLIEKLS